MCCAKLRLLFVRIRGSGVHMDLLAAVLERQWWADAPMNDGLFVRWELNRNPYGYAARCCPEDPEMRKQLIIRCSVKVDVAACLRAVALFVYLFT
jgi:hypothetical protein